jgi:phage tail sheath protein FI
MGTQLLASKIVIVEEEPKVRTIQGVTTSVTGFLGITEKGPVGEATLINGVAEYDRIFGGYVADGDVRQAIDGFFQNGGTQAWVTRTVHYTDITDATTKTSAQASVTLLTGAVAAYGGSVTSSNIGPYNLEPGDTLVVDIDGAAPATATFNAAAAARENTPAETYALANNDTLTVRVDQGAVQTITFLTSEFADIANATAEEVAAVINAKISDAKATVTSGGTKVTITSDKRGTSSYIEVTGGTGNGVLGFATAEVQGTGNVADIDAVSVAETKTIVEAAVANVLVTNVGGAVKIQRVGATGPSAQVQVDASSTADTIFGFANAVYSGSTGASVNTLKAWGKYDGTYAHVLKARVAAATSGESARFNLDVLKNGILVETFPNVTMDSADERYVETIVNNATTGSKYISVEDLAAGLGSASLDRPVNVTSAFLSGGDDGLTSLADTDFTGADGANGKTGLRCFDTVQDLNILTVPGRATAAVHNAMITYAEVTRAMEVFAVLDPPEGETTASVITYFESAAAVLGLSEFGACYWPRIKVLNPSKTVFGSSDQIVVPPSGHIAGVYSRVDGRKPGGVFDPPAGVENGILFGCLGFENNEVLEEPKRDLLLPKRINPLTTMRGQPNHIDGARTLKGSGNFPYINERRGAIFIEQSIKDGLQFARQKKNTEELRQQVARTCEAFLLVQMKNGAFRTNDPATAFFVDFGDDLNPPSVQFAGQLVGRIGIATAKPAEYIVLNFSQDTRALEEELAA